MARFEAQAKLLYYPTPASLIAAIASHFKAGKAPIRLIDPCCGTGAALADFKAALGCDAETLGIELSQPRAEQAKKILDTVFPVSFYTVRLNNWSNASVSLVFNNPPYDWSEYQEKVQDKESGSATLRRLRHETIFVENVTPRLVVGGHQVIIIPRGMLGDVKMTGSGFQDRLARHLLGWYEQVAIFRFPDGEYEKFRQVVVYAISKRKHYIPPTKEQIEGITRLANPGEEIPVLAMGSAEWTIPSAPERSKIKFRYTPTDDSLLVRLCLTHNPIKTPEYRRATYVRPIGAVFTPAAPLSVGHLTMLIAGQETGILKIKDETGEELLVKGMSRKVVKQVEDTQEDEDGHPITSVVATEHFEACLAVIRREEPPRIMSDQGEVGRFITANAEKIADSILNRNKPRYDFKPTAEEWRVSGQVALGLPPLAGREERGLFSMQRHFAIAAARTMKQTGVCILNAEMGFGVRLVSC